VVVARSRPDGSAKALYGYVLVNGEAGVAELQAHAAQGPPAYLVPAATFVVQRIPSSARAAPGPVINGRPGLRR
jgi:hypothetical protein